MSPVDLSNLKLTEEEIVVDTEQYVDPSEFPSPIPDGIYLFKQGAPKFDVTTKGFLQAEFTHEVLEGPEQGGRVSFDRISNKPFDRQGVKVNMMTDHLRALGDRNRYRTHQEYADAVSASEGKPFKAQTQWEGYCAHKDPETKEVLAQYASAQPFNIKGMKSFPSLGNGNYTPETKCTTCGASVQARTRISRRIPS